LSEDARHMAFVARQDRQWHVVHDGRLGDPFDKIPAKSLRISREGNLVLYEALQGKQAFVIVGTEAFAVTNHADKVVSFDGSRVAWIERTKQGQCVVVNDSAGLPFEKIAKESVCFSLDGAEVAYAARKAGRWHVVRNGLIGPPYLEI